MPLRNLVYSRLFLAQAVALVGTGLATVALALLADRLAGAAAGAVLGTALAIKMAAYVGVAPLAAALAERLPRRAWLVGVASAAGRGSRQRSAEQSLRVWHDPSPRVTPQAGSRSPSARCASNSTAKRASRPSAIAARRPAISS